MLERMIVLLSAFGGVILFDGLTLRQNKLSKLELTLYMIVLLIAVYLGFDYMIDRDWLDLFDVIKLLFGGLSTTIDNLLNVKK